MGNMFNLVGYECKKFFFKYSLLCLILVLLCANGMKIFSIQKETTYLLDPLWVEVHGQLYEEYSGEMTVEKIEHLLSRFRLIESDISDFTASTRTDNPDTLTGNIYSDYYLYSWFFVEPMEYMWSYKYNTKEILEKSKENLSFYEKYGNQYKVRENEKIITLFQNREIVDFQYTELVNEYSHYEFSSVFVLLLLLYVSTTVFSYEYECKMDKILLTHKNRSIILAKMVSITLLLLVIVLLFALFDLGCFILAYGTTEGFSLPFYALRDYSQSFFGGSILSYAFISTMMKFHGFFSISMIFLFVAQSIKKPLIIFLVNLLIGGILFAVQNSFENLSNVWIKAINPYSLVANNVLLGRCEFVNLLGFPVPLSFVATFLTVFVGAFFGFIIVSTSQQNMFAKRRGK